MSEYKNLLSVCNNKEFGLLALIDPDKKNDLKLDNILNTINKSSFDAILIGGSEIEDNLFKDMKGKNRFYFLHSYYFDCYKESNIIGVTDYGFNFTSAIKKDNIFGVQFHPEKSHHSGVQLLKNYSEI